MWKKLLSSPACGGMYPWRLLAQRGSSSSPSSSSSAISSLVLRSLKEHYQEVSKMAPPPKVSPPSPFTIVKGALDNHGPVLRRTLGDDGEEMNISVMRLANIIPGGGDEEDDGGINQLFLHVDVSKPRREKHLHFLCGLYPDAMGIHSVSFRPQLDSWFQRLPSKYQGPAFQDLDEKVKDAFHNYLEERGVNESLFPFLQAWLYVKDHRSLMQWFKAVGTFIKQSETV